MARANESVEYELSVVLRVCCEAKVLLNLSVPVKRDLSKPFLICLQLILMFSAGGVVILSPFAMARHAGMDEVIDALR